ncbi:unnamed protein product [Rotaria magnacalcarata]|uniref:Uncharacterized protein n=5 Tax=Rotaria magnacalcarata TaxID=392030 RepID=A0A816MTN1_9BILA|nr:unnamed protein product [Rotaria magnacalcarata]
MYQSIEVLKDSKIAYEISKAVNDILEKKGKKASASSIIKASKNAVSLLLSKKKRIIPTLLSVYLPATVIETVSDTVVPTISSDEDKSEPSISSGDDDNNSYDSNSYFSSSTSHGPHISFSMSNNLLKVDATFEYLEEYFKHSLSMNSKSMNLEKIVIDICTYVFLDLNFSVSIRELKNELSLQISRIVQSARVRAAGRSTIGILRTIEFFSLVFKFIICLNQTESKMGFVQHRNNDLISPILLIRDSNSEKDVVQLFPFGDTLEITFNEGLVKKSVDSFDLTRTLDIEELSNLIEQCTSTYDINLDVTQLEETIKTTILFDRKSCEFSTYFLTVVLKLEKTNDTSNVSDQSLVNSSHSFSIDEIDDIIGRTYTTRGVKRTYEEDSISIEPEQNMYRRAKIIKDKRDLLHLKDTYYLTDCALHAIFQYMRSKKKLYSLKEIERLRKKTNTKFPILFTSTSAYVKFEYAVRTAIFVARKHELKLDQFDTLTIRFNMDGTLIGNKHIVAISINCIEGGRQCQTATNLVPLGLFEVQKENTELLRKTLPVEFINDIKSVKHISIGGKDIDIRVRLGGDLMNAVYVFGLAGFSSNYACIFCTQHKDDLHVTEDTAYDKNITEVKGINKKTVTVRVGPTSYHDPAKRARSLAEQFSCLAIKPNDLGYKCEPLFGDLFNYQDYCVDTLHLKLRVFDVILKDILSYASRTGKYGGEHLAIIENKIKILNQHCERTVGKRFFFQVDSDDKNKTIASHGKLSGHLQDLFFVDNFPYKEVLSDEIAKSARAVVNKFKEILNELKSSSIKRNGVLKRLSLEFVKEFRQSGLRTTVTPYIHIIGNHLFEFHELNDLRDYNMQGVEKSNDLLSRLYFSSTNPAKNPLLTMLQKLYRMLEMNFQDEEEREAMTTFALTGVYDFVEDLSECESNTDHQNVSSSSEEDSIESENESEEQIDSHVTEDEEEREDEIELEEPPVWAPEKRFCTKFLSRSENRFKSFRRS